MRHRLLEFLLAEARCRRDGRSNHPFRQAAIGAGNRAALSTPLCFDGLSGLCYIECFSRESLRAPDRPVPARGGHRVRSRLRTVRDRSTWALNNRTAPNEKLKAES